MAATVAMDSVYALGSVDEVVTTMPTEAKAGTKRRRYNLYEAALTPIDIGLKILGMGENNFKFWLFRYMYHVYFLSVLAACSFTVYNTYLMAMINALKAATLSNLLDQYAWLAVELIWLYTLSTVLIFLVWAVKLRKVPKTTRLLDEDGFDFLHRLEDESDQNLQNSYRRVTIKCYVVYFSFMIAALAWPIFIYVFVGVQPRRVIYSLAVVPMIIINTTMALAFAFYVCTAEMWGIYNYSIRKESDEANRSIQNEIDFEMMMAKFSKRYDAVSNLTASVAHMFRYFAIVHLAVVITLITQVYQTLFDRTVTTEFKIYAWIDIAVQLTPLFAAATVSTRSLRTATTLHTAYRGYKNLENGPRRVTRRGVALVNTAFAWDTVDRYPSPAYRYFYQRVANEDMCTGLDIAGMLSINKTTVAAMIFAAVNWCAVVMQFRQGSSGPAEGPRASNGTDVGNGTNTTFVG